MRNISFLLLIIISFFLTIDDVNALVAGSTSGREIKYQINSVSIGKDETVIKGYAYLDKHNNYHVTPGTAYGLTEMNIYGKVGNETITPKSIEFHDGTVGNYDPEKVCWRPSCIKYADANSPNGYYWGFANPENPYDNLGSEYCIYKHVYFTATFNTRVLRNKKNKDIKFIIDIGYHTNHEKRNCIESEQGLLKNGSILQRLDELYWGADAHATAEVKEVLSYNVSGTNNTLDYGMIKTKVTVTNNGNEFKLKFKTDGSVEGSVVNKNKNVDLNLYCEDANFYSGSLENVSTTYKYTAGTGRCEKTVYSTISADYVAIESGNMVFSLDRGPIYAGGAFGFKVEYINTAKWYYVSTVPECPLITVSGITPDSYESCHTREDGSKSCRTVKICVGSESGYDPDCNENGESRLRFEEKITSERYTALYNGVSSSPNVKLKMDNNNNSNSVTSPGNTNNDIGEWVCENDRNMDGRWEPNTEWTTRCTYKLKESKLNRMSADVTYNNNACSNSEICKSDMYYVPLKWMNDKFNVFIDFGRVNTRGLSTINGINWHVDYTCNVDIIQMLYNKNGKGYQFFYRPIDLNNPFPNRDPSTNWISWWNDNINKETLKLGYNNKEYSVALSPDDMRAIKDYNKDMTYNSGNNLGYLDYSINVNGKSNFVDRYMNRYTTDYNKLGEVR